MPEKDSFVKKILDETKAIKKQGGVPFSEVIENVTGYKMYSADDKYMEKILKILRKCFEEIVENSKTSPIRVGRVNELGNALETVVKNEINDTGKLKCVRPKTRQGKTQLSGYPDLLIEDGDENIYIEVKTYSKNKNSLNSSFRTFYYEPKGRTNKVNKDAYHIMISFGHIGKDDDKVGYLLDEWHLVDLSKIKVIFKGEFQSSNKKMYQDKNIIAKSKNVES